MKILITGGNGQVGRALQHLLKLENEICTPSAHDCDIANKAAVSDLLFDFMPDVILHCAAYTAVDKAEETQELCFAVNSDGTRNIAECASRFDSKIIYLSSDYVFDGTSDGIYETNSKTKPINVYGKSKLDGENIIRELMDKHFIVRTSWVFGDGKNFVRTMIGLGQSNNTVKVVSDQIGSPTYAEDLARLLVEMLQTDNYGTYHATNEGFCSWHEFACEIFRLTGLDVTVKEATSAEFKSATLRPFNSRLSKECLSKAGFHRLPHWTDALKRYIANELR